VATTSKNTKKKPRPTLERKPPADIRLPEKIATRSVTAKSLGKGTYQKAILAAVAPILIPEMINSLRRNAHMDDMQANKLIAEIFGMAGKKDAGIVLNVNQQNSNVAENRERRGAEGPVSFEDIARILEEEGQKRKAISATFEPSYEATPDSLIEQE
jgi:hypothetical protein